MRLIFFCKKMTNTNTAEDPGSTTEFTQKTTNYTFLTNSTSAVNFLMTVERPPNTQTYKRNKGTQIKSINQKSQIFDCLPLAEVFVTNYFELEGKKPTLKISLLSFSFLFPLFSHQPNRRQRSDQTTKLRI